MAENKKIIIIDDSQIARKIVSSLLKDNGFEVYTAECAKDGYDLALQHNPEVIVLDVVLPDGDGIDICRTWREDPKVKEIPILLISGDRKGQEDRIAGLEAGSLGYIIKPFSSSEMIAQINVLSQLRQTHKKLEKAREHAEKASKCKSMFLSNISHDLRSPLNCLLVLAADLAKNKEENLNDSQMESIGIIKKSGTELLELISDILDLSKVEAGKLTINVSKVGLSDVLEGVRAIYRHLLDDKQLAFTLDIADGLPEYIRTDRKRLDQIIRNFMSNAIKFTFKGSVAIHIDRPQSDVDLSYSGLESDHTIAISITDSGIGIPPNKMQIIFEEFQQAGIDTAAKFGGTGLGLSICKNLSHLLGGEVQVTSVEGKGSTFVLYIPEVHPGRQTDVRTTTDNQIDGLYQESEVEYGCSSLIYSDDQRPSNDIYTNIKALIVDNDMRHIFALSKILRELGMEILKAPDGEQALEILEEHRDVDLALLDLDLPNMDGLETLKRLRLQKHTANLPVIMVSGASPMECEKFIDAGANEYINKPVEIENLLLLMNKHLPQAISSQDITSDDIVCY